MAGRGRRLGGYGEKDGPLRRPGEAAVSPTTTGNINITALIGKINDINVSNIDPILLHETEILFKQLFVTGEAMKDILSSLYAQALNDSEFGEKLVIALEQVWTFEVDNEIVRREWLNFMQHEFEMKETTSQSNLRKFVNAVMLLGDVFNIMKVRGTPITVIGCALLDYIDFLVQCEEEIQFQVLTTQIILNGNGLMMVENASKKIELLKHSLRKALIKTNITDKARCWILLAIDYISNNLKPLSGVVREFYVESMGDDYLQLEERSKGTSLYKTVSNSPKPQISPSSKSESESTKSNKSDDIFQDIENLNISNPGQRGTRDGTKSNKPKERLYTPKSKRYEDGSGRQKKQGSEIKINTGRSKSPKSEDDFYGIQIEKRKVSDKKE